MSTLVRKLTRDFPDVAFTAGSTFSWSPKHNSVVYRADALDEKVAEWSLLHELGHALLGHNNYVSDFHLVSIEVEAWQKAKEIASAYTVAIEEDHIQNCLDTYRDWLYQRSTCPSCTASGLQTDKHTYVCLNCDTSWRVSNSRLCRAYRRTQKETA